jgi:hypothetical protein
MLLTFAAVAHTHGMADILDAHFVDGNLPGVDTALNVCNLVCHLRFSIYHAAGVVPQDGQFYSEQRQMSVLKRETISHVITSAVTFQKVRGKKRWIERFAGNPLIGAVNDQLREFTQWIGAFVE